MVTAELGMASLVLAVAVVVVAWLVAVLGLLFRCQSTAWEVARQEARGDRAAVQQARDGAPAGARVGVSRSGDQVRVVVELAAQPWAGWLPVVPLTAQAVTRLEPGAT
ncbi:MAG: TadE family type IV pilus minor pilin [Propionicimonas sp.]